MADNLLLVEVHRKIGTLGISMMNLLNVSLYHFKFLRKKYIADHLNKWHIEMDKLYILCVCVCVCVCFTI
jgi:hypothetical protein